MGKNDDSYLFEEDEEDRELEEETVISNLFVMTEQQKNSLNKKLPKGFFLAGEIEIPKTSTISNIDYVPVKKERKIASEELEKLFPMHACAPFGNSQVASRSALQIEPKISLRPYNQLPEGKSRQTEKIKTIISKLRKNPKFSIFSQQLSRVGFLHSLNEIEAECKRNIHTIDSFKERYMFVFAKMKEISYTQNIIDTIDQLIEEFLFQVQQARKMEFESSLANIQTSIDKITREITNIKESGNYYRRKKKKSDKNFDEKQLLYLSDLVCKMPSPYLVGVWQIVQQKAFSETLQPQLNINLTQLKPRKLRQIEYFVKKKITNHLKSRERKKLKKERKKQKEEQKIKAGQDKKESEDKREDAEQAMKNEKSLEERSNMSEKIQLKNQLFESDFNFDQLDNHEAKKEGEKEIEFDSIQFIRNSDPNQSSDSSFITDDEDSDI